MLIRNTFYDLDRPIWLGQNRHSSGLRVARKKPQDADSTGLGRINRMRSEGNIEPRNALGRSRAVRFKSRGRKKARRLTQHVGRGHTFAPTLAFSATRQHLGARPSVWLVMCRTTQCRASSQYLRCAQALATTTGTVATMASEPDIRVWALPKRLYRWAVPLVLGCRRFNRAKSSRVTTYALTGPTMSRHCYGRPWRR